ncbi:RES domain-containing protein [Streptomyces sp. NPDC091287]|uniref:RES domain-containing protein n=1 Tax=Streptomyces sp. NPDC091287 TaxID=3365988 RepID=UPI003824A687
MTAVLDPGAVPPVELALPPNRGIWRLGKSSDPLKFNRIEPETIEGSSAGRFSLFTYGMLYCASEQAGCYAEALAHFRVQPKMRELLADEPVAAGRMKLGHLASSWRDTHILVRLKLASDARFLDVDADATREVLRRELRHEFEAWGIEGPLSEEHIHGRDRRVARQIAAWTVAQRNAEGHRLAQGIAYRSGYGGRRCWAVLSGTDYVEAERRPILAESVELKEVAREYGLTVR